MMMTTRLDLAMSSIRLLTSFVILMTCQVHMEVQRQVQYPILSQVGKGLVSFCLFLYLKYFHKRQKEGYIQLVSEISYYMAAKLGHQRKVTSAELLKQTCKQYGGCTMSVLKIENSQKSSEIGWALPI